MPDPTFKTAQQQREATADRLAGLPRDLQSAAPWGWSTWRYQHDDGHGPVRKEIEPGAFGDFASVLDSLRGPSSVSSGIGFELSAPMNLLVITLRGAFQRHRAEHTKKLVHGFGSYAERSLDDEDLQIIARGECRAFAHVSPRIDIDVTCGPRFIVCTGKHEPTSPSALGFADRAMLDSLRLRGVPTDTLIYR